MEAFNVSSPREVCSCKRPIEQPDELELEIRLKLCKDDI
jgi:hypothetical protein